MTRDREINLLEANLKDFLFEFMYFSRIMTENDKNNELMEKILRLRNFARKLADMFDEMYKEELKGGDNGKGKD